MNASGFRLLLPVVIAGVWLGGPAAPGPAAAADAPPAAVTAVDASGPYQVVDTSSQMLLQALDAHRAEYRKDPQKLHDLVDRVLLPHFDVDYAARLVLGQTWRSATPEQRSRFTTAFYTSLLRTYGDALLEFTADKLKVFPVNLDPGADRATVRTEIKRGNGDRTAVNYSVHNLNGAGWKVWDVTIEGISYVKSFRDDFASEIEQKGLDSVIARLESGELKAPAAAARAGRTPG
jgi:phospholipid transport system substrate-binding protein